MSHANAIAFFALCSEAQTPGFGNGLALNFDGADLAPEWIQLMPRGPRLRGNDGRTWLLEEPQGLVEAFNARGLKRPIDINHAAFLKAPRGEESPAAGWIEELAVRDGAIFARVDWTPKGREAVLNRDYRYISASFNHDAKGNVVEMLGAGLVNTPNFTLPALNSETRSMFKDLLKKLGLPETATEAEAVAKVGELQTALNSNQVSLASYVPRADYEIAVNRAATLEAEIGAGKKAAHDAEAAAAIDEAVKAGKISPATKSFYVSTCASAEGLAEFKKFVAAQPTLFQPQVTPATPAADGAVALNAEQNLVAEMMGVDAKAFSTFVAPKSA
jgi:phage I-like protein